MSNEQAPLVDLAEGERLLAELKAATKKDGRGMRKYQPSEYYQALEAFESWAVENGEALVAALKAAQQGDEQVIAELRTLKELAQARMNDLRQARADLARVEAERDHWRRGEELARGEWLEWRTGYDEAQARIAELEGCLRDHPCACCGVSVLDEHRDGCHVAAVLEKTERASAS